MNERKLNKKLLGILVCMALISAALSVTGEIGGGMSFGSFNLNKSGKLLRNTTNISGLYFLREEDPSNQTDVGSLLREAPLENEVTFCGMFIVFHFAEEGEYSGVYRISNIYYHLWQKTPEFPFEGEIFDLGYTTSGGHGGPLNESITINTSECISVVDNYRLVQAMQVTNPEIAVFENDDIYNFTVKSFGNGPRIRTYPNQYSFIILNLEDNETLQGYDRDGDYLNDYDELFVYVTNPFDNDTDDDGVSDYDEYLSGSDPNNYTDTLVLDVTPPTIIINFAGNLSDSGGPYWRPPDQVQNLTNHDIVEWRDGYYTNNSRQQEDWMYINLTVNDTQSEVDEVWLHWLNETTWTDDSYQFVNSGGIYWEFNTSGNISTQEGYNYSFDVWVNDTCNNIGIYHWNKTIVVSDGGVGGELAYTRRYVQLNCIPRSILYSPFYLYEFNYSLNTPFGDRPIKDQWDHDQGPDGSTGDTGVLGEAIPGDYVHARYCAAFYGYWFDDSICIEPFELENVYFHMWWNTSNGLVTQSTQGISYKKSRDILSALPPYINYSVYKENARSEIDYRLKHYYLETNLLDVSFAGHSYTDNDIYELSVYFSGPSPWGITNRSITSFIILNVPDNATLNSSHYDTDEDALSDWTELYVTYTNPFLADTDNDGATDYEEVNGASHGYWDSDPNNYTNTTDYRYMNPVTWDEFPKNRYISFTPAPLNQAQAFRVTCQGYPGWVKWVGEQRYDGTYDLVCDPVNHDPPFNIFHVGSKDIGPERTYNVSATFNGNTFSTPVEINTSGKWGDIVGSKIPPEIPDPWGYGWTPPAPPGDAVVNLADIMTCIAKFQGDPDLPIAVCDIHGDGPGRPPDRVVNLGDILAIICAFQGEQYPYGAPEACPEC